MDVYKMMDSKHNLFFNFFHFLFLLLLFSPQVSSYATGAPFRSCDDLYPQHYGSVSQNSITLETPHTDPYSNQDITEGLPFPYRVEVLDGEGYFTPFQLIRFRITGEKFRGFLFQVRDELERSRGKFVQLPSVARTLSCRHDDDTITQKSGEIKTDVIITWRAPENQNIRKLFFRGSIVESEMVYWTNVYIPLYNALHSEEL